MTSVKILAGFRFYLHLNHTSPPCQFNPPKTVSIDATPPPCFDDGRTAFARPPSKKTHFKVTLPRQFFKEPSLVDTTQSQLID